MNIKNVAVALVTLIASSAAQAQQAVQWKVSDGGNGHWYQLVNLSVPSTWHQARAHLISLGGDLVSIISADLQALVVPLLLNAIVPNGAGGVWIGAYQLPGDPEPGGFRWVNGAPFGYTGPGWAPSNCCSSCPGESGENYVTIASPIDSTTYSGDLSVVGHWNDAGCVGAQAAVIEWSADCNNDGIVDYGQILQGQLVDADANGVPDVCEVDPCPGDITGGGFVDAIDLSILLAFWGSTGGGEFDADVNNDGIVEGADLSIVLSGWGPCPN